MLGDLQNKHDASCNVFVHNTLSSEILLHLTTKYSRNSVFHVKLLCLYTVRVHPRSHARPPALSTASGGMGAGGCLSWCFLLHYFKLRVAHASVIMVNKAFTGTSHDCIHVQRFPFMVNAKWTYR